MSQKCPSLANKPCTIPRCIQSQSHNEKGHIAMISKGIKVAPDPSPEEKAKKKKKKKNPQNPPIKLNDVNIAGETISNAEIFTDTEHSNPR